MKKNSNFSIFANGILKENPVLVLILGTCPTLATTTNVFGAFGMGIAAMVVLICSNLLISLLRNVIPDNVRIPCYIVIIAGFVTVIQMLVQAFFPELYNMLGVYVALIVVNCIILGRAEMFASKNTVGKSVLDGLGMGLGFTLSLMTMGFIREFVGSGTIFVGSLGELEFGLVLGNMPDYALSVFVMPAGGFLVFGLLMALINWISEKAEKKRKEKLVAEAERIEEMKHYLDDMAVENATVKVENLEGQEVEA